MLCRIQLTHIIHTHPNPEFAASSPSMDISLQKLRSSYISKVTSAIPYSLSKFQFPNLAAVFPVLDASLSFYFRYCGLSTCTVDIDDQTYLHFWRVNKPDPEKPNLVIIHGYGANSKWQFLYQIGELSKSFNIYAPDLVFFGKSNSKHSDRTDTFQARCVAAGMKKLGVLRYSVYGISYGGYVVYQMAQLHPEAVEKVVIASCGIKCSKEMVDILVAGVDKDFKEVILPQTPEDFRLLVNLSFGRGDPFKWLPDAIIQMLLDALGKDNLEVKKELAQYLLTVSESDIPNITQETLLLWGDLDKVFPVSVGINLERRLGPIATLEIVKNAGHALNMESPYELNSRIKAFLGVSRQEVNQ